MCIEVSGALFTALLFTVLVVTNLRSLPLYCVAVQLRSMQLGKLVDLNANCFEFEGGTIL